MKKALKILLWTLLVLVVAFGGFLLFATITEYRPSDRENLPIDGKAALSLVDSSKDEPLSLLSWNIGFGALGDNADFFMDGGKAVQPSDKDRVQQNIQDMIAVLKEKKSDFIFLQEVDVNSTRTYHIDETQNFREAFADYANAFAYNLKTEFIPYPLPPIGKVGSGLLTLSKYALTNAERTQLPVPFTWPTSMFNLKRCLLTTRIPVGDKELVLINLHLEAYDDGEGKIAQTNMLREIMEEELAKGNYVIAGGDFNQTFDGLEIMPIKDPDRWTPGAIESSDLPEGFSFAVADNCATCRSLVTPLTADSQLYIIDGFIVSDNLKVELIENVDDGFTYSDHNPVRLTVTLLP